MRIGIDGHMLGDHSGGNESYYTNILKNLPVEDEDEAFLFIKKGIKREDYMDKFTIVEFQSRNAFLRNFIELPKLCRKYKLDLLHTQYFIPFYRPCPVVCTIHDICFEHYKNIFTKKEYYRQKLLIPYAAKKSKYIFTVSEHAKKDIVDHYHVDKDKVIVTYNAVNENFKELSAEEVKPEELRSKFGIASDYILSVGNLQPRKNLVRLIRAYRKLKTDYPITEKLVIVGKKAWMFDEILNEALSGDSDIIFTDYVTEEDLVRLYNDAKIFVYPSFFEGFGIPPLEAMACGAPVAVANTTSLPEVVGDSGLYFNPFDEDAIENAIFQLLKNDVIIDDCKKKAKMQVKCFSWVNSAKIIYKTYGLSLRD